VAPETATEQALAEIWALLLKRDRVGVHDNFFDLGGHSLLAMQMLSRVRDRLSFQADGSAVFAAPTIYALAQLVDRYLIEQAASMERTERQLADIAALLDD
jgi:aryl carrier-like protein